MTTTTLEEVWSLFREVAEAQRETDRRFQETDRQIQATSREVEKTQQEVQKTQLEVQKTQLEVQKTQQEVQKTQQEVQKTQREIQQVNRQVNKQISALGGQWGLFFENLVAPACERLFSERGIPVHMVSRRVMKRLDGETLEIDVLVVNAGHVVDVEVKSSLGVGEVRELLEDLERFRRFFPEYADKTLYSAVAGMRIEEGAAAFAYRQGLFVIAQTGDSVGILNDAKFAPRAW